MADHEGPIHRAIVRYLRAVLPNAIVHHSPNEGVRGGKAGLLDGARKAAMGQVAGWPDIEVFLPAHIGPVLFEVKAPKGRVQPSQAALHEALTGMGYRVAVVRSIDDVRACMAAWGIWLNDRSVRVAE